MNNDIERYNFWHSELENFIRREKLKEMVKKLEEEKVPKKILETFHHTDMDNRHDF